MSGYVLLPEASAELKEIVDFLAEKIQDRSDRVISEIHDAIRRLIPFLHLGHKRSDLTSKPLRFQLAADYLIRICPGGESAAGRVDCSWPAKSQGHGRNFARA